jgi:hypothetical protein
VTETTSRRRLLYAAVSLVGASAVFLVFARFTEGERPFRRSYRLMAGQSPGRARRAPACESTTIPPLVYAYGALSADREGWVSQAR